MFVPDYETFFFFLINKGRNYVNFNELPELVTVIYQNLQSWRANRPQLGLSALLRALQNFDFNALSKWVTTRNTTVGSFISSIFSCGYLNYASS